MTLLETRETLLEMRETLVPTRKPLLVTRETLLVTRTPLSLDEEPLLRKTKRLLVNKTRLAVTTRWRFVNKKRLSQDFATLSQTNGRHFESTKRREVSSKTHSSRPMPLSRAMTTLFQAKTMLFPRHADALSRHRVTSHDTSTTGETFASSRWLRFTP
jgi:hypothetical protein